MRTVFSLIVLLAATAPAIGAPPPREKAKAEAAAALALASSCDCPAGARPKCGDVAEVLAKVSRDMIEEAKLPAVAPMPREKVPAKCDCKGGKCDTCPACDCPTPAPAEAVAAPAVLAPAAAPACQVVWVRDRYGRLVQVQQCPGR